MESERLLWLEADMLFTLFCFNFLGVLVLTQHIVLYYTLAMNKQFINVQKALTIHYQSWIYRFNIQSDIF